MCNALLSVKQVEKGGERYVDLSRAVSLIQFLLIAYRWCQMFLGKLWVC